MEISHAKQIIQDCIEFSGRVFITNHAKERMIQRKINRTEIEAVLTHGNIVESPHETLEGGFKLAVESFEAGRTLRVALVIDFDQEGNKIIVVTVIAN